MKETGISPDSAFLVVPSQYDDAGELPPQLLVTVASKRVSSSIKGQELHWPLVEALGCDAGHLLIHSFRARRTQT